MNGQARHIVCPHCDSVNRIPLQKPADKAKCGRCHNPLFARRSFPLSTKRFAAHIQHNDIPVVVDFWAEWCGPCKAMAPAYERVAAELEPDFRFFKVNTEAEEELAARYNIRSIPTLMLFHKGSVVAQRAGAVDAQTLRSWLRAHAPASASRVPEDRVS
jgi:thioredoxin 2